MGVPQRFLHHTALARPTKFTIGSDTAASDFTLHQIIKVSSFAEKLGRQVMGKRIVQR